MAALIPDAFDWRPALVVITLLSAALFAWILAKNPRSWLSRSAAALQLSVLIWLVADIFINSLTDYDAVMAVEYVLWIGAVFIPSTTLHFLALYSKVLPKTKEWLLAIPYVVSVIFYPLVMWEQNRLGLVKAEVGNIGGWDISTTGIVYQLFALFLIGSVYLGLFLVWRYYFKVKNRLEKRQIIIMSTGLSIAGVFGPLFSVLLPIMDIQVNVSGGLFVAGMTIAIGYVLLRYDTFDIVAEAEGGHGVTEITIQPGQSYLVKEAGTGTSYAMFRSVVATSPGLCLTSFHPEKLRQEHELAKTPIVWVTETETEERHISPYRLDFEILYTLETFMKQNTGTAVLIDDIQYLSMVNGFEKTAEFLRSINDIAAMNSATLIVPVDTRLFGDQELARLASTFDEIREADGGLTLKHDRIQASYAYMYEEERPAAVVSILRDHAAAKLCITKTYPEKFRSRYDLGEMSFYWLTTSKKGDARTLDPRRLDFELTHTVAEFLRTEHGTVIIHGVEDMIAENDIGAVADFLKGIIDIASEEEASIVTMVDPATLLPEHLAILESRFDVIQRS